MFSSLTSPQPAQAAAYSPSPDYESCRSLINRFITPSLLFATCENRASFGRAFPLRSPQKSDSFARWFATFNRRSYFYQITMGCGTVHCTNRNCFSSPDGPRLDPTSAALLAVKLAQSTTHFLCAGPIFVCMCSDGPFARCLRTTRESAFTLALGRRCYHHPRITAVGTVARQQRHHPPETAP